MGNASCYCKASGATAASSPRPRHRARKPAESHHRHRHHRRHAHAGPPPPRDEPQPSRVVPGSEVPWLQKRAGAAGPSVSDRYILGKVIRTVGSVVTCAAVSVSSREVVACKTIPKSDLLGTPGAAESLQREVSIMAASPWPARLHAVYEDDDHVHLVMHRCDGLSLGRAMRLAWEQGRVFTEEQAAMVAWALVNEVRAAHANGVMLRYLVPDSFMWVFVPSNGGCGGCALNVVDFSLAVQFRPGESETFTDERVIGSLPYMAPEVFEANYGTKADVWSVGVIIYQLITGGRHPFPPARANDGALDHYEAQRQASLSGVLDLQSAPWPLISDDAKNLVRQMLQRDPARRPTIHQVHQRLRDYLRY